MKTDKELYQDVTEKLDFEPGIDPRQLTYSVHNGIVTINGKAHSYLEKRSIVRAIRQIHGVKAIADEIEVKPVTDIKPDDNEIATNAVRVLEWDSLLPKGTIKVTVSDGKITLTGNVPWYYQKQGAEKKVRYLAGVTVVDNQIVVKPALTIPTESEVKEKIRRELLRHVLLDAQKISVEIVGTSVTLKGTVQSWAEARDAAHIAWSIPGISHVDNQIIINSIN